LARRRPQADSIRPLACDAPRVTARLTVLLVLATGLLAACGDDSAKTAHPPGAGQAPPPPAAGHDPLALPPNVPVRSEGPGERRAIEVIRAWTETLRTGDIDRAASYWGLPAKIQNATPVLTLRTRDDVRAFNLSLTCGAILTAAGRAKDYTILKMRLTSRRGADCGSGVGRQASTAIRVVGGKIVEWYRLPDDPQAAPPRQPPRGTAPATTLPRSSPVI
jgi:hypothetical protein